CWLASSRPPVSVLFPYTTLFRSRDRSGSGPARCRLRGNSRRCVAREAAQGRCRLGTRARARAWVRAGAAAGGLLLVFLPAIAGAFGLDDVARRAEEAAQRPYQDPRGAVPEWLLQISYDQWRDIRFRPEQALWRGQRSNFEIQFFHPGLFYDRTVKVHVVDAEGLHEAAFSPSQFDYGKN